MRTEFDLIVIGAGMAGLNAMDRAVAAGATVALIERERVGGTCPLRGCIPSKALVRSAEVAHEARRAAEFGVRTGPVEVDFGAVMARVREIIDLGAAATRAWVESLAAVELVDGEATFVTPGTVRVGGRVLSAPRIVIATGARPAVPPVPGLASIPFLTSDDVFALTELPARLVIIGAGPIALEMGQALARLGSRVTMVEVQPRLLPDQEAELADLLALGLAEDGIALHVGVGIVQVAPLAAGGARVTITRDGAQEDLEADALLVATGRAPDLAALGLDAVGIRTGRGVAVDTRLETSRAGVFAAGDVLGPPWGAFTHVARRLGVAAAEQALGLADHPADPAVGPHAVFADPELASVGMTEDAARAQGLDVRVGTARFRGGKARAWGKERGLAKVVAEAGTGRILGAHMLGYHAADLIHPVVVAMTTGGGIEALSRSPHIHPTLGEVVKSAAEAAR